MLFPVKKSQDPKRPMREVAYHHIQKKIASRVLVAGAPVSEITIAKELGISRTPAREAIRQLISEGLLDEMPGRGIFVVTLDRGDIVEIYELRRALEDFAVRKAAASLAGAVDLENLKQLAGALEVLAAEGERSAKGRLDSEQMRRFEAADIGFHLYILEAAGNQRLTKWVSDLRSLIRIFAMRKSGHQPEDLRKIYQEHRSIIDAIEAQDPKRAAHLLSDHIESSQRERLKQFDLREQEARLPRDIKKFLSSIESELS